MNRFFEKLTNRYNPYIFLFIVSFFLYANTLKHQYALDDGMVIINNDYVLKGIAGLEDIFTKDMLDSYYRKMNSNGRLSGGRFRPLSIATFAIEQEFIGKKTSEEFTSDDWDLNNNGIKDPEEDVYRDGIYNQKDSMAAGFGLRHLVNVVCYSICVCLIFLFCSKILFKKNKTVSLFIALLFAFHPIHTEVVANVKSRDEILSLIFIITTILSAHTYYQTEKIKYVFLTTFSFLLAMFSKEYGVTLFLLIPVSFYLFEDTLIKSRYIITLLGLGIGFSLYVMMRLQVAPFFKEDIGVESEILNNPYLYATSSEALATKFYVLLKYFFLLVVPYPLISDYGYNSIPYIDISSIWFYASLFFHVGMLILFFHYMKKRSFIAFLIIFYLSHLALISNLIGFNLGATMGERLIYHSSLAYCAFVGYLFYYFSRQPKLTLMVHAIGILTLILFCAITVNRNKEWENDNTLYLADVKKQPESVALNNNASGVYLFLSDVPMNKEKNYLLTAKKHAEKAVSMHPNYVNALIQLCFYYGKLSQLDSAEFYIKKIEGLYPSHPLLAELKKNMANSLHSKALDLTNNKDFLNAIPILEKANAYDKNNIKIIYDLGVCFYNSGRTSKAVEIFKQGYDLDSMDIDIRRVIPLLKNSK